MDFEDHPTTSRPDDRGQSQSQNSSSKMLQTTPEDLTTKSNDQKILCSDNNCCETLDNEVGCSSEIQAETQGAMLTEERHKDGIKSSIEFREHDNSASGSTTCLAPDNLLSAASNFPKKEIASLDDSTGSTCAENERCDVAPVEDEKANESVGTVSTEVVSNIGNAVDMKLEMVSDFDVCNERNDEEVISEGTEKRISDAAMSEQAHRSSCDEVKSENEAPARGRESHVRDSCDINFPSDIRIDLTSGDQKNRKAEATQKPDSLRPIGRSLHDLGLDLVREQVYKDLIGIQIAKSVKNMLDEKEKEQLNRLTDAHTKLVVKNAMYQLPLGFCRCSFSSSSANVLALHHEFGSTFEAPFYICCLCEDYKTRWSSQFQSHLECSHQLKGRLQNKLVPNVCKYCPYEHKNQSRMEAHADKCLKKFRLGNNLQPLPADCDVPLMGKMLPPSSSQSPRPAMMAGHFGLSSFSEVHQASKQMVSPAAAANVQPMVMEIDGQLYSLVHHNGKALFTSLRSQIANVGVGGNHNSNASSSAVVPGDFPRFLKPLDKPVAVSRVSNAPTARVPSLEKCEMCDAAVKDRDALWNHFRLLHKVELSRVSMIEKEPWMTCDVCFAKFWTYQGLTRHSVQLHKRGGSSSKDLLATKTFKCFLCLQTHSNPLNHLSTFHNITLLDMYHSRRCCMCNRRFRSAPAFEEHMVLQHRDIFANKDVLCTVLHALSTARSLKRQETTQHRATAGSFLKTSPQSGSSFGSGSSGHAHSTVSSACLPFQKNFLDPRLPSKAPTPNKMASPSNAPTARTGQPEAKKRHRHSSEQSKESDPGNATKTPPKKSTEEDTKELNKLYSEYADIGRPILRSMRHRLSQNSSEKVVGDNPMSQSSSEKQVGDNPLSQSSSEKAVGDNPLSQSSSEKVVGDNPMSQSSTEKVVGDNPLSQSISEKVVGDNPKKPTAHTHANHITGLSKSPDDPSLTEDVQKSVTETNSSEEPLPKRLCTESSSTNSKLKDSSFQVNQQQEMNGDLTSKAECQKACQC